MGVSIRAVKLINADSQFDPVSAETSKQLKCVDIPLFVEMISSGIAIMLLGYGMKCYGMLMRTDPCVGVVKQPGDTSGTHVHGEVICDGASVPACVGMPDIVLSKAAWPVLDAINHILMRRNGISSESQRHGNGHASCRQNAKHFVYIAANIDKIVSISSSRIARIYIVSRRSSREILHCIGSVYRSRRNAAQ